MAGNFHESFGERSLEPPSERSTGFTFAAVALIVAYFWQAHIALAAASLSLAIALAGISLAAPTLLKRLNIAWFRFSLLLNKIVTPVLMLAMFALVIVPCGLIMQLRSDPLRKRRRPDLKSYWIERCQGARTSSMTNQF